MSLAPCRSSKHFCRRFERLVADEEAELARAQASAKGENPWNDYGPSWPERTGSWLPPNRLSRYRHLLARDTQSLRARLRPSNCAQIAPGSVTG